MKQNLFSLLVSCSLLFSCSSDSKNSEFVEIPVDIDQNNSLTLSEITETMTAIELELTDESVMNPQLINRVFICDDNVIVTERKILIFNTNGKFIRSIGSKGQGPGEYNSIANSAIDEKNKRLFVNASNKIIVYDFYGNYLREYSIIQKGGSIRDINYINNELLVIVEYTGREYEKGIFNHSIIYQLNEELQITDSCTIRNDYFETKTLSFFYYTYDDFILNCNSTIYLYYPYFYNDEQNPKETALQDTLYRFEKNYLIPELKMKFKNDGMDGSGNRIITLLNIYRSSRYTFAIYYNNRDRKSYCFCYDTKTEKGYNMKDGYVDDINQIDKPVTILPLNSNTEMFYYWHTTIKPDDLEEPNPTIYIGKLKK